MVLSLKEFLECFLTGMHLGMGVQKWFQILVLDTFQKLKHLIIWDYSVLASAMFPGIGFSELTS